MSSLPIEHTTGPLAHARLTQPELVAVDQWLHADVPGELAQIIAEEFDSDHLERLAAAALEAAVAAMQPGVSYADRQARNLAQDAVRYALGLKELPTDKEQ